MPNFRGLRIMAGIIAAAGAMVSPVAAVQTPRAGSPFAMLNIADDKITWELAPDAPEYSKVVLYLVSSSSRSHQQAFNFLPGAKFEVPASAISGVSAPQTSFHYELRLVPRTTKAPTQAEGGESTGGGGTGTVTPPKPVPPLTGAILVSIDSDGKAHVAQPPAPVESSH